MSRMINSCEPFVGEKKNLVWWVFLPSLNGPYGADCARSTSNENSDAVIIKLLCYSPPIIEILIFQNKIMTSTLMKNLLWTDCTARSLQLMLHKGYMHHHVSYSNPWIETIITAQYIISCSNYRTAMLKFPLDMSHIIERTIITTENAPRNPLLLHSTAMLISN
jgi:hypothetical protein